MKINKTIILLVSLILLVSSNSRKSSSSSKKRFHAHSNAETKILPRNASKYPEASSALVKSFRGSVFSLVGLEVSCYHKKGPLTKFHLYGKNGFFSNDIAYEWGCHNDAIKSNPQYYTVNSANKANYARASNSPKLLNNVDVDCKDGFISSFQLQKSNIELYYTASCVALKQKACESKTTNPANVKWLGFFKDTVSNLDQVPLEAPAGKALVSFKLLVQDSKVLYEYKACEIDSSAPVIELSTARGPKGKNVDNLNLKLNKKRRRY